MVIVAYLIVGVSGTLVALTTAPPSVLLVLRFAVALGVLGVVFARPRRLAAAFAPGVRRWLLLMGVCDAASLLLFFTAVREIGVAVATFLYFMQPVWIALLAPRILGSKTEGVVWVAIGAALAGLAFILVPALSGETHLAWTGLAAGLACGLLYAAFALLAKDLSERLESSTLVLAECTLDLVLLLPLAMWQTVAADYSVTRSDLLVALVLGVLCTAVATTLWMEGMQRIRMQHSAVLGFLTPVAAPFFAFALAGQTVTAWTAAGGVLILGAGLLVAVWGRVGLGEEFPQ
jgi:drug/metabolite transporter (DMT)-like permease